MARFLFAVWPFPGHVNPTCAIADVLRRRGHDVAFYTGTTFYRPLAEAGFTHFAIGEDESAFYNRLFARYSRTYAGNGMAQGRQLKAMFDDWIIGSVPRQVDDLNTIADQWRPDAMVCDPTMLAPYLILHETRALPVAVFSFFAGCLIPGSDAPPIGLGLPRPHRWYTRVQARVAARIVSIVTQGTRRAANETRRRYGLRPLSDSVATHSGRMPLYLVATSPEYDCDRRDLPSSVSYIGACLWDKPRDTAAPAWLDEMPGDQPVVYATEGTSHSFNATLLRAAARGLADRPMRVVLTTGGDWRDPAQLGLGKLAPNIRVERFVPHSDLFPRLNVVVTSGGSGTVQAALAAGLPLVVIPTSWDQFDNAQRVMEAGAGLRLNARRCTPERLRAAVQQILAEPSFRANARRMGLASARCGGPERAAELLEGIVPDRPATGSVASYAIHADITV